MVDQLRITIDADRLSPLKQLGLLRISPHGELHSGTKGPVVTPTGSPDAMFEREQVTIDLFGSASTDFVFKLIPSVDIRDKAAVRMQGLAVGSTEHQSAANALDVLEQKRYNKETTVVTDRYGEERHLSPYCGELLEATVGFKRPRGRLCGAVGIHVDDMKCVGSARLRTGVATAAAG